MIITGRINQFLSSLLIQPEGLYVKNNRHDNKKNITFYEHTYVFRLGNVDFFS